MRLNIINDIKYFFERLFSKEGKPLLMLSIISVVMAVLSMILYIVIISGSTTLNIPIIILYTYFSYFFYRLMIRFIQYILKRINVLHYHQDEFNYLDNDINAKIRKYNNSIYVQERDRYEATIVFIVTLAIFLTVILTFIINAETIIKIVMFVIIIIPFFLFIKEPYEIITIDVPDQDLIDMTKKDFYETFLDLIFKEKQITSLVDLPGQDTPEPEVNYTEEQYYAQEEAYNNQLYQEQQQFQYSEPMMQQPMMNQPMQQPMLQQPMMNQPMQQPMVDAPTPQDPNAYNPFDDAQREIDPNQIPKQWWQQ